MRILVGLVAVSLGQPPGDRRTWPFAPKRQRRLIFRASTTLLRRPGEPGRRAAGGRTTNGSSAAHEVGAPRGWFRRTSARRTKAHSGVPGAMGHDPEITNVRIIRIRSARSVHPCRDAEHDEHVLWHGNHAVEGQDHDVRRDERHVPANLSRQPQPSRKVLNDPTYAGYSTGHWEGDALVVETVALRDDSLIEDFVSFSPHSEKMTVHERIRLLEPGVTRRSHHGDRHGSLLEPFVMVRTFRKAANAERRTARIRLRGGSREGQMTAFHALLLGASILRADSVSECSREGRAAVQTPSTRRRRRAPGPSSPVLR